MRFGARQRSRACVRACVRACAESSSRDCSHEMGLTVMNLNRLAELSPSASCLSSKQEPVALNSAALEPRQQCGQKSIAIWA